MKRLLFLLSTPLLLVFACFVALAAFDLYVKSSGQDKTIDVLVPKGAGLKQIATIMTENNIAPTPWVFEAMVLRFGAHGKLKAGEYAFPARASAYADMLQMTKGEVVIHNVTIPEGWTIMHIYGMLQNIPQLTGDISPVYREGDLLPETYRYVYGDTRDEVLARMHAAMERVIGDQWSVVSKNVLAADRRPLTTSQLLTLASIVEKETRIPAERARVAAVYLNRLRIGMKLQADPTVAYALTRGQGELGRMLTLADMNVDSPYNTYRYAGLPPGPICNPGKASIEAALHPLHTDELYFVADGSGGHRFARTMQEHAANVALYRAWEAHQRR